MIITDELLFALLPIVAIGYTALYFTARFIEYKKRRGETE
jgi:hypothetical protein